MWSKFDLWTHPLRLEKERQLVGLDDETELLEATAQDFILLFQRLGVFLQLSLLSSTFQFTSCRLQETPVRQIKRLTNRQRDLLRLNSIQFNSITPKTFRFLLKTYEFVANEDVTGVLLRIDFFGDETEKLLFGLVVGAVRNAMQRVLMKNPLQNQLLFATKKNI